MAHNLTKDSYFHELVERYSDTVLRLAITYLKNLSDAEDVCQNVYIKLYRQGLNFEDRNHEKAWVIRVTINECKDLLKSNWKRLFVPMNEIEVPIEDEESKEIVSFVLTLPIKYRRVIYLYYYESYSTSEISELLNKKDATIRTQLSRAREILKNKFIGGIGNEEFIR